jgi:hypothetical protein
MDLLRRKGSQEETGLGKTLATTKLSSPGLTGRSSTPRLLDSIAGVSGMLGRPVKPGDDSSVCFFQRGRPEAGTELAMTLWGVAIHLEQRMRSALKGMRIGLSTSLRAQRSNPSHSSTGAKGGLLRRKDSSQ